MTQEQAVDRRAEDRAGLAGAFEEVYQRVARRPGSKPGRILATFAASLANGEAFNLTELDRLIVPDRALALSLLEYCLTCGLTEDERREVAAAFAPFVALHAPGTRH